MAETLYLIDGHAQIFRAYYAIRGGLRSPVTGEPTHAVFGFAAMLLKLLSQLDPQYVACAVDMPGKTFRDDLYEPYKGTREAAPDDLHSQVPRVFELVERFGIPVVGKPGLEADDIIATITERLLLDPECADIQIRIVSKDKDLEQLLCDRVSLYDVHTDALLDPAALLASRGITPAQVIDFLTLTGDTVDNVPGVEGIGPKTAAQLLQQFGSLDALLGNLDQIKGKRRENLENARAHLPLSRRLVTLVRDGDFPFALSEARVRPPQPGRLIPFFQEMGFHRFQDEVRSLAARMGAAAIEIDAPVGPAAETPPLPLLTGFYEAATSVDALAAVAARLRSQPILSLVTETAGPAGDARLCGLSLAWEPGSGVYIPVRSSSPGDHLDEESVLSVLRPLLEDPALPKCGHNLKLDARALLRAGVKLRGVVFDSMLASMLMDAGQPAHQLEHLVRAYLAHRLPARVDELDDRGVPRSQDGLPLEGVVAPAAAAADAAALRLFYHLGPQLEALGMGALLAEVEAPLASVLAEMEIHGILCDPDELLRQGESLGVRVLELRQQVREIAAFDFHLDSTQQLAEVLFDRLGLASGRKTKTGRSTDMEVLDKLAAAEDPADSRTSVPRLIIEYRHLQKLINTYLGNLRESVHPTTGRIHTSFQQLHTATGRLASHGPNLQNVPVRTQVGRQIRKAFHAPPGQTLICADYSQVELRILAHFSEDPALLEMFGRDLDIHTAVAAQVYGVPLEEVSREQRSHAKTINFGIIYGVSAFGLARRIDGLNVAEARVLISGYRERFPGIDRFLQQCIQHAVERGYVSTILGRRRLIPELQAMNRNTRALGERLAINSVVQGSGADLIKAAMVNVQRRIDRERLPLKLLLQIHDELVFESPIEEAEAHAVIVCEEMERAMELRVPLRAEAGIGRDWMTAK